MTYRKFLTSSVAVAGAVTLALSLTGCSNPLDNAIEKATERVAENGTEKLVEGMTGGDIDIEFTSVPDGFPAEVPLISEDVVQGLKVKEDDGVIYSVTVTDSRDVASITPVIEENFTGWEETFSHETAGLSMRHYADDYMQVGVTVAEGGYGGQEGGSIVQYSVSVPIN
jgi:hypothetical protein